MRVGNEVSLKLCRECYKRKLSLEMAIPIFQVLRTFGLSQRYGPVEFTTEHDTCENCLAEFDRIGYDPCVERVEFSYDIQKIEGKRRHPYVRVFAYFIGFDAVSMDGHYLGFIDSKIQNWLAEE